MDFTPQNKYLIQVVMQPKNQLKALFQYQTASLREERSFGEAELREKR